MSDVVLGKLVEGEQGRDAIHIAIISMIALKNMEPGEHLTNGIVDPYLTETVKKGEKYWLCLYPNTVTSLRHVWTHPAFSEEAVKEAKTSRKATPAKAKKEDAWRTPTVLAICESIRLADFETDGLPILADALEEAGYANARVLGKCREQGYMPNRRHETIRIVNLFTGVASERAIKWLEEFAEDIGLSYTKLMEALDTHQEYGEMYCFGYDTPDRVYSDREKMWECYELVTGKQVKDKEECVFRCAC